MGIPLNSSLVDALQSSITEKQLLDASTEPSVSWPPSLGNVLLLAGVLTFALQLLIVAVFFYKFWSHDKQIREIRETREKQPKLIMKDSLLPLECDGGFHSGVALAAAGLYAPVPHSCSYSYYEEPGKLSPAAPHLPCNAWDLVQR